MPFELLLTLPVDFLLACLLIALGYYCCLSEGSSTVGVDVIALILYQKKPQRNLAKMIRQLNVAVLLLGFFTYGLFSVTIGLVFSVIYAWFLDRFLVLGEKRQRKQLEMAENC